MKYISQIFDSCGSVYGYLSLTSSFVGSEFHSGVSYGIVVTDSETSQQETLILNPSYLNNVLNFSHLMNIWGALFKNYTSTSWILKLVSFSPVEIYLTNFLDINNIDSNLGFYEPVGFLEEQTVLIDSPLFGSKYTNKLRCIGDATRFSPNRPNFYFLMGEDESLITILHILASCQTTICASKDLREVIVSVYACTTSYIHDTVNVKFRLKDINMQQFLGVLAKCKLMMQTRGY